MIIIKSSKASNGNDVSIKLQKLQALNDKF